jgi:hypothetical protein
LPTKDQAGDDWEPVAVNIWEEGRKRQRGHFKFTVQNCGNTQASIKFIRSKLSVKQQNHTFFEKTTSLNIIENQREAA